MKSLDKKRREEKEIVKLMVELYCRGQKHTKDGICEDCMELISYAHKKVDLCPFMESKTFCEQCKVHCYKSDMREKISKVMKYSGPRMAFYHPIISIQHLIASNRYKRSKNN